MTIYLVYYILQDARNDLYEELGGYETVAILQSIQVVDDNLLKILECLPEGSEIGDCILVIDLNSNFRLKLC